MTKGTGLGHEFYADGYKLSGGINAVEDIGGGAPALDFTAINQSAMDRLLGIRDGRLSVKSFLDGAAASAHDRFRTMSASNQLLMYCAGTTVGSPVACLVAKQANYDATRNQDGSVGFATNAQGSGYGLEWCELLTADPRTDTAATNGSGVDDSDGEFYISLPGSSGNTVTTPDAAALDITGDLDIRAKIAPNDWTPAADGYIVSKYTVTGNQRSYALVLTTTGTLILQFSADGVTGISKTSTANLASLANGAQKWVRATLDVDNGASGYDVKFYTSDDGSTWTQLGATITTATATSVFAGTAVLEIGSRNAGTSDFFAGKVYEVDVKSGIGGTSVAHPIPNVSGLTDATGRVWTLNGTAAIVYPMRFGLQAHLQVTSLTGTDVTVKLQHSIDNGVNDAWSDVTGGSFGSITAAPTAVRIETARNLTIKRYLRVVTTTTGGFTNLVFRVAVEKNLVEVIFHA
ncbi:hypothetical protein UK23_29510 [Lentzea aerocolonigenes]|uniref:Uncharacterized protein n=1 Tax=Lentzea aerocolonigenes TaxID=68170 RepID=A0A0F0GLS9_LENAE|nr:hypothetical protein [Lentzea aerocolonigenes]KJK44439.1 hypothetical protein UK23_29510 [Lentzea aerocolonigenes]